MSSYNNLTIIKRLKGWRFLKNFLLITFPTLGSAYLSRTSRHKQTLLGNETTERVSHFEVFSSSQFIAARRLVHGFAWSKMPKKGKKAKGGGKGKKGG